jgi:hypothetical protein
MTSANGKQQLEVLNSTNNFKIKNFILSPKFTHEQIITSDNVWTLQTALLEKQCNM